MLIFKYFIGTCFLLLISSFAVFAQLNPGLSQFSQNAVYLNPANAGAGSDTYVQLHYRNQWTQYQTSVDGDGNLGTQLLTASMPLGYKNLGLGLLYVTDKTPSGVGQQAVKLQVGYHYPLGDGFLSMGVGLGMQSKSFDGRVFRVRDANDPITEQFSGRQVSASIGDVSAGIVYNQGVWSIGLAADHLNSPAYPFVSANIAVPMMLNLHFQGEWPLSSQLAVMPFAQIRYISSLLIPEMGARMTFRDRFWVGGSFRFQDAAIAMFGMNVLNQRLSFGYAIDYSVINAPVKSTLTHELFVKMNLPDFKQKAKSTPIRTPRFRFN